MKRRQFLKVSATATVASPLAFPTPLRAANKKFRWRLVMVVPKTLPVWGEGVVEFAERVKQMTDGRLNIKVYGAGELVPALGTFDAVRTGKVQMGHSAAYYWQGKLPAAVYFTAVPFGLNANGMRAWLMGGGGQELWNELYSPYNVVSFAAGNTGLQMGGWFNKEIKSIADFKGLKMRIPGLGGKVIAKAGGKPILVAGGEIFTNLSTGVIDATEWVGPYHDYVMGFYKAAKFYYYPGWHEPGPVLELMVNKKAMAELPKAYQQIIKAAAAELDRDMYAKWLAKDAEYLEKIKKEGRVQLKQFPGEVLNSFKKYAEEVRQEVSKTSSLAKRIDDSFNAFQKTYREHQALSEYSYAHMLIKG